MKTKPKTTVVRLLLKLLSENKGDISKISIELGLNRLTVLKLIQEYDLGFKGKFKYA